MDLIRVMQRQIEDFFDHIHLNLRRQTNVYAQYRPLAVQQQFLIIQPLHHRRALLRSHFELMTVSHLSIFNDIQRAAVFGAAAVQVSDGQALSRHIPGSMIPMGIVCHRPHTRDLA